MAVSTAHFLTSVCFFISWQEMIFVVVVCL